MKKKWIYIEPFVFIWQDESFYLFYNSLNGKKVFIPHNNIYSPIVQSLLNENNLYCTPIENSSLDNEEFVHFVNVLIENKLGNIVECLDSERPVNIPPKLMLSRSVENSLKNGLEYFDPLILDNVRDLTIQVSGYCDFICKDCRDYKFQLFHCEKNENNLSNERLDSIIQQVKHLKLQKLNIVGGNILELDNFEHIVEVCADTNVLKIYNVHHKQISIEKIKYILSKDERSIIRIIFHCDDSTEDVNNQICSLHEYNSRILWSFVVCSEYELEFCYSIIEKFDSIEYEIKPYYNKLNRDFIREFVFIDNDDIQEIKLNRKQVFANQVINKNYFGSIFIQANGDVYDNLNFNPIGNVDNCLEDIVHTIVKDGKSWRLIRSNEVCNSCLYKLICPPPSNLEICMDSQTICQKPRGYAIPGGSD